MVCGFVLIGAACGADPDERPLPTLLDVPETVAIGVLPDAQAQAATLPPPPPPPTTEPATSSTAPRPAEPIEAPLADHVAGNRMLMIGDSILASAAPRNEGLMCDALVLFGWQAAIDAEPGRNVDFAHDVLDERLEQGDDWDAFALSFGNQVDGTDADAVESFRDELDTVLARLDPKPVVVFTLVDAVEGREVINDVLRGLPETHPNVLVVEFADAGSDGVDVVDEDALVLTEDGMKRLSIRTAAAVGTAPGDDDGECLPSDFVED